jgi:coproporphyrinogen III oxidase-like Fe-S oxidoreductase
LEKTVPLYKKVSVGQYNMPDDSLVAEQYILADKLLSKAGFNWYEISSWAKISSWSKISSRAKISSWSKISSRAKNGRHEAKNGRHENQNSQAKKFKNAYKGRPNDFICKHNLGYWQGGQWLGIGAGAAGSIKNKRFLNSKSPIKYVKLFSGKNNQIFQNQIFPSQISPSEISQKDLTKFLAKNSLETLSDKQVRLEKIMLASRTKYGLDVRKSGITKSALKKAFDLKLIDYESLEQNYIVPTLKGRLLHNYLVDVLTNQIS